MSARKKTDPNKPLELNDWDWITLVASWRYYEHGSNIVSASFPEDILTRFWRKTARGKPNHYSDKARWTIANQFANIDHGTRGEEDWTRFKNVINECYVGPWVRFYRFCEGFANGFHTIRTNGGHEYKAFRVELEAEWYEVENYIERTHMGFRIPEEVIAEILQPVPVNRPWEARTAKEW